MAQIFISFRGRADVEVVRRIRDRLNAAFPGDVLRDIDAVPDGAGFDDFLRTKISKAKVAVALIGDEWLTASGDCAGVAVIWLIFRTPL